MSLEKKEALENVKKMKELKPNTIIDNPDKYIDI